MIDQGARMDKQPGTAARWRLVAAELAASNKRVDYEVYAYKQMGRQARNGRLWSWQ